MMSTNVMATMLDALEQCETTDDVLNIVKEYRGSVEPKLKRLVDIDVEIQKLRKEQQELDREVGRCSFIDFESRINMQLGKIYLKELTK